MPKAVFLNIYYDSFLDNHYQYNEGLQDLSYKEQLDSIQGTMFGDSDFYSHGIKKVDGWDAVDIITNCETLQRTWAMENGVSYKNSTQVLVEQLYSENPEVVYTQGMWVIKDKISKAIKPMVKLIVGQCGVNAGSFEAPNFDIIFSALPNYVEGFRNAGTDAHYLALAFDPRVLKLPMNGDKEAHSVTFVGGLTGGHKKRRHLIQYLCRELDVACWGYGYEGMEAQVICNYHVFTYHYSTPSMI